MRLLMLLIVLTLCTSALLTGCDQRMEQSIMEIVISPRNSLEKAQAAMEIVNERRAEVHLNAEETGDFSTVFHCL